MSGRGARSDSGGASPRKRIFDPTDLFRALAEADIAYILVGGLAVGLHGYIRGTRDLDICPDPDEENLRRLAEFIKAVDAVNADEAELNADEIVAHDLKGLRGGGNFRLSTNLGPLDLMQYIEPFGDETWATLDRSAETRTAFGVKVRSCSYEDLLKMKQAANRPQDQIDVESLRAARREL